MGQCCVAWGCVAQGWAREKVREKCEKCDLKRSRKAPIRVCSFV
jgi:hypothetical protein